MSFTCHLIFIAIHKVHIIEDGICTDEETEAQGS